MSEGQWILVVEPCEADRELIDLAVHSVASEPEIVYITGYDQFVATMVSRGNPPSMAIIDWFATGGPASCLDTLQRLGFLARITIVATSRDNPIQAIDEASSLGVTRFVSKRPDDFCFKKKIAEAVSECLPGVKRAPVILAS